jgi:hypothetical protein
MTIKELPTVNFDSNPGYDEFKFLHSTYSEEFKNRSLISNAWGIVDLGYDPSSAPFDGSRALNVSVSPVNTQTIDISSGFAVTESHLLIDINATVPSVPLPDIASGKVYVIAVEYNLVTSPQTRVNRYGDLVEVRLERPSNIPVGGGASTLTEAITIVDINDYNNTSIFDTERKSNLVVIAITSVQTEVTTGQLYLEIDLTRNSYAFNRPWFSARDVDHRSKIGSGLITDNNPHGTELQDLSSAGLTLYQQLKTTGGVLAKDTSYYGYAGKICSEEITLSRWESDLTGEITERLAGRYFVRLTKLPIRTGSLYIAGKPWEPIPYEWVAGTRIIMLGALENPSDYSDTLVFEYFTVDALEVNAESPSQGLQFLEVKQPLNSQEFIVSGGLAISELTQTKLSLPATLGSFKRGYKLTCDSAGTLVLNPQPILASVKVVDLQGTTQTVNQAPHNGSPVYLTIGLTKALERTTLNATTVYDLDLKVQITGVGTSGGTLIEELVFKGSQWKDQAPNVNEEEPLQFLRTVNKYQLVSSIALANTLSEPHNAGPEAELALWADALSGTDNQEFASVASFFWTGTTGIDVKDERVISTSLDKMDQKKSRFPTEYPEVDLASVSELFSVLLDPKLTEEEPPVRLMTELDDDRVWGETWEEFSSLGSAGDILLVNPSYLTIGQTIRLSQGKYIEIIPPIDTTSNATIDATTANASMGEVNFPPMVSGAPSADIFRNNLIATINDPAWDSTWFAVLGTGSNPPVMLSRGHAYPEGYQLNYRQRLTFSSPFGAGDTFDMDINGVSITQTVFSTTNNQFFEDLVDHINLEAEVTEVTASIIYPFALGDPYSAIVMNGNPNGDTFVADNLTSSSGAPTGLVGDILDAFTLTQPIGGRLPTPHLPQRYPSALTPWGYMSRPVLWSGLGYMAEISVLGRDTEQIGNGDAIEIAPNKIIKARAGSGATADPSLGEFLVDSTPLPSTAGITNTLNNIASTINHPVFNSGVHAEVGTTIHDPAIVGEPCVQIRSGGRAATTLRKITEVVGGTWLLSTNKGATSYVPHGRGVGHVLLKARYPLGHAEWRWTLVGEPMWSPWTPMEMISETAYTMVSPPAKDLYQFQVRLDGGQANAFSLYSYIPEVSSGDIGAINTRLEDTELELSDARGTSPDLDTRLSSTITSDGTRIQDPEFLACEQSIIQPDAKSVKDRLDFMDTMIYYTTSGGVTPREVVTMQSVGVPPLLLSGPPAGPSGDYDFITPTGPVVGIGGDISNPLAMQIQGYNYAYSRKVDLDFTGEPSGTYYIYFEHAPSPFGMEITSGTVTAPEAGAVAGSMYFTDPTATFVTDKVKVGHTLAFPDIEVGGHSVPNPLNMMITSVTQTMLGFSGRIPSNLLPASYTVYSPREGQFGYTTARVDSVTRVYLGETNFNGAAHSVKCYRYLNKYQSNVVEVTTVPSGYIATFNHNLGILPTNFVIYFWGSDGSAPTGLPKVLQIGDECVVGQVTTTQISVKNRYADLVARNFLGLVQDKGFIQLVI